MRGIGSQQSTVVAHLKLTTVVCTVEDIVSKREWVECQWTKRDGRAVQAVQRGAKYHKEWYLPSTMLLKQTSLLTHTKICALYQILHLGMLRINCCYRRPNLPRGTQCAQSVPK